MKGYYNLIALKSDKMNILVVGGGKAAFIKVSSFLKRGCKVTVLSPAILPKLLEFKDKIKIIKEKYKKDYILDKHLVVIATDNESLNSKIRKDCDDLYKIYIDSSDKEKTLGFNTCQRESENMIFSLNTKKVCPKATSYIANKIENKLYMYDEYVNYITRLREFLIDSIYKNEIMNFTCSDDFYYFYKKGYGDKVLEMFYYEFRKIHNKLHTD